MSWKDDLQETSAAYLLASSDAAVIRAVAGPGSGKSFAIKKRILRLLEDGVQPEEILAITFTRTAAHDLKKEISSLGNNADKVHVRTVHSHALKILMKADVLGITNRFPRMVIEHEIIPALRDIDLNFEAGLTDRKKLLDAYLAGWAVLQEDNAGFAKSANQIEFETKIKDWLISHKGLLVGEVVPVAIQYLRNNPMEGEIGKYHTILVDEYQDLNKSEQEFIKLVRGSSNIVIVGDDDQSIYGFKFAYPTGIQELDAVFGEYENITFDECRRCPKQVTEMASSLIQVNKNRTLGPLIPSKTNPDGIVQIVQWGTLEDEIEGISLAVKQELEQGIIKPEDVLILTPRRLIGYKLREKLEDLGINAKSYFREDSMTEKGGLRPAYSLMNLLCNPEDLISLRFLLGDGSSDSRTKQYLKIRSISLDNNLSLRETLERLSDGSLTVPYVKQIVERYKLIRDRLSELKNAFIANPEVGISSQFVKNNDDAFNFYELEQVYQKALLDVGVKGEQTEELFNEWYPKVFAILQESISMPEVPEYVDHVRIMSLHASKGLGAKFVILSSMVDRLMPFRKDELTDVEMEKTIEEQRRLFYVALTRCKASNEYQGRLIISSFTNMVGVEALRMGMGPVANINNTYSVSATRFIADFRQTSPVPIKGVDL